MPSALHQTLCELFHARPHLAAELLASARLLPSAEEVQGELLPGDLSQSAAPEYRADVVVRLTGATEMTVIVEAQLQPDPTKAYSWPVYVSVAQSQRRGKVALLVLTLNESTARWAAQPVPVGITGTLRPVVIGPKSLPVVTELAQAQENPEIAVLSALAHGRRKVGAQVGRVAAEAARTLDAERRRLYTDLILQHLNRAARRALEKLMIKDWQPESEFLRAIDARQEAAIEARGEARGKELGKELGKQLGVRELLVRLLRQRFGSLPPEVAGRVEAAQLDELNLWTSRLLEARSLAEVFEGAAKGGSSA
ncbi:DUF4351 domain-containing protein [Myxococcota bacterium]|nr:DUF4351 domain-containing protein [Myxococcota bacterium]